MNIEGASISVGNFSSAPSSSIGSFSSFETSNFGGGSFNPDTSFADFAPMTADFISPISLDTGFEKTIIPSAFEIGLADINLNPDVPEYQVPEAFYNAFEEPLAEEIFTPSSYLETIYEPTIIAEPEIAEIPDEILEAPSFVIPSEVTTHISVIPVPEPESKSDSSQASLMSDILQKEFVQDGSRIKSGMTVSDDEINEPILIEAVEELVSLSETTSMLPEIISEPVVIPDAIQAETTYESLITAGIAETEAVELVQTALIQSGTEPEAVEQILTQVTTATKAAVEEQQIIAEEPPVEIEDKSELLQKETELKPVLDQEALAKRDKALEEAVELATIKTEKGEEVVDSKKAAAGMPTEEENEGIKSGILSKVMLKLFSLYKSDGSYRLFVAAISKLGFRSKWEILRKGWELNRKFIPVTIAPTGKKAEKEDVQRVINDQPNSVTRSRNLASQPAV